MHRTAITRKDVSAPMKWILENLEIPGAVLHYGEGKAYLDTAALRDSGADVAVYEPYPAPRQRYKAILPADYFDMLVSIYILNVLEPYERNLVLSEMKIIADRAVVAVRTDKIAGTPHLDGVITKIGTFQKSFSRAECESLGRVLTYNSSFAIIEL